MKQLIKYIILLCALVTPWAVQAQSTTVYSGTSDVGGTTEYSQYLYIGPFAIITIPAGKQWIIASQYVYIDPGASISGPGQMIFENPGKIGTLNETVAWAGQPTTVHGGNSKILTSVLIRNPNNIVLGWVTILPSAGIVTANTDNTLYIGSSLTWAAKNADSTALMGNDIVLADNDLRFSSLATHTGSDANSFAVTNGTGHVVKDSYSSDWLFPVGIAEGDYTPATVSPAAANGVHVNVASYSNSSPTETTTQGIERTWNIYGENVNGAYITLQHNTATNQTDFKPQKNFVSQYGATPNNTGDAPSQTGWQLNTITASASTPGTEPSSEVNSRNYSALATSATANEAFYTKESQACEPFDITVSGGNSQNIYKTDGSITITGFTPGHTYLISYNFNGTVQSGITYQADAAGKILITGFTKGTYDAFDFKNDTGCSTGVFTGKTVTLTN